MEYVSAGKAAEYYHVSTTTLGKWADEEKIEYTKTSGGHRRYKIPGEASPEAKSYIYARVSSRKQKGDLQRQSNFIEEKYPNYEVIQDIGSGLNFKRQGFRRILEQLFEKNIREVVISSADRFSRFGTREFFCWLFERFGGKLTILKNEKFSSPNETLAEDLLEIITVFSARYHGGRSYKTSNKKGTDLSKLRTKKTV